MSISFVEYRVDNPQIKNLQKDDCSWSNSKSILAVSAFSPELGGTVKFLNENGLPLSGVHDDMESKPGVRISTLLWHPYSLIIAVSWESGEVGVFSMKKSKSYWIEASSESHKRQRSISSLQWMNDGKELLTVDISGLILIWDFNDVNNQLIEQSSHQLSDHITEILIVKSSSKSSVVYLGSASGVVYQLVVSTGAITDVIALESGIKKLLYYPRRNRLIMVTESMLLCQYSINSTSNASTFEINEVSKVKLNSSPNVSTDAISVFIVDENVGVVAVCIAGERVVRLWQLETGHNAAVIVAESAESHWSGVNCVDYRNGIMAAGTSNNHVIIWKRTSGLDFNRISQIVVKGGVKNISVSASQQIACITTTNDVYIVDQQNMCYAYNNSILTVQTGAKLLKIKGLKNDLIQELKVEKPIKLVLISSSGKMIGIKSSGSKQMDFYSYCDPTTAGTVNANEIISSAQIKETENMIVINEDEVVWSFLINNEDQNCTFSLVSYHIGNKLEEIHQIDLLVNTEAIQFKVIAFDLNGENLMFIISISEKFYLYIFRVDGIRQSFKSGPTRINTREITCGKINSDGTIVACTDSKRLFIICSDGNQLSFDTEFKSEINDFCWAENESRLLCLAEENLIHIVLCNPNDSIVKTYDVIEIERGLSLITLIVPYIYFLKGEEVFMKSLSELEGLNADTTSIMLDFLTATKIDLNQMIKRINQSGEKNEKLWTNLARLSVKSRDINMGMYCMSKLQNARVVRDIKKELEDSDDSETACAILAMNLGLHNEAEEILKACKNNALLSEYYQGRNEWEKAIECVDRLNVKSVYYNYAKHLEHEEANIAEAIKYYEKSGTHVFEVPRMLFDVEGNSTLEKYCLGEHDKEFSASDRSNLIKWWGQYSESLGDINQALDAYEKGKDYYNLVRLLCYNGQTEKAKAIINNLSSSDSNASTSDTATKEMNTTKDAAMLHLGRHLESSNPVESINYYLSCGAIKHAIRVCKTHNLINELIKLTVNYGNKTDARELVAKYVEQEESQDDLSEELLVQLYYKCGYLDKAIESALRTRTLSQLRDLLRDEITKLENGQEVEADINEGTVQLALESLKIDSDMIDIVIDLLLLLKNEQSSLIEKLVIEYNIEVNEKLVEKIEKVAKNKPRNELTATLADLSLQQGQYLVAAKLYNNLGQRSNAIKALIRTGQMDKIINYANIARDKNVYKIAANYLETMNYADDKVIKSFYKKANAKQELDKFSSRRSSRGESGQ